MDSNPNVGGDIEVENAVLFDGCDVVLDKVFGNGLIFRKLEKMLSYGDMKACRIVCRRFKLTIDSETDFGARSVFKLKEETVGKKVLETIGFTVKHVKIYPFDPDPKWLRSERMKWIGAMATEKKSPLTGEDVEHVYENLRDIETIRLVSYGFTDGKDQVYPSVKRVIEGASGLNKLELRYFDMDEGLSDMKEKLGNLKEIAVHPVHESDDWADDIRRFNAVERLTNLITGNQGTLECLYLYETYLWKDYLESKGPTVLKTLFPMLKELHLRMAGYVEDEEVICSFLEAHLHQLKVLTVRIVGFFPVSILDVLKEMGGGLEILNIETMEFDDSEPKKLAFLRDCKNLKEFKLQFLSTMDHNANGDSLTTIISYIPNCVRKLSLIRLPSSKQARLNVKKIRMISQLTSLKLVGCFNAVNDKSLQGIFKYMTNLEELEINEARKCTDEGFTGRSADGTAMDGALSISNLKSLKSLVLKKCGITDRTVEQGIRFARLTYLDVSTNKGITAVGCRMALANNPVLESLCTEYLDDVGYLPQMKVVKENYPYFRSYWTRSGGAKYDDDDTEPELSD